MKRCFTSLEKFNSVLTMSSREIAWLTLKNHPDVLRDIRVQIYTALYGHNLDDSNLSYPLIQGLTVVLDDHTKRTKEILLDKASLLYPSNQGVIALPPLGDVPFTDESGRNRKTSAYVFSGEKGKSESKALMQYALTIDAAKNIAMLSQTAKGKSRGVTAVVKFWSNAVARLGMSSLAPIPVTIFFDRPGFALGALSVSH